MTKRVAIVGSGPTAIYALQDLISSPVPLIITVFEAELVAGKGTPYQRGINDPAMLSNIPSVEIPELPQSLVDWLATQPDRYLREFDITRENISDRSFYPRVVVGDFFRTQFETIVERGAVSRHVINVVEDCRVTDIIPKTDHLVLKLADVSRHDEPIFDYVIAATGHSFPSTAETSPGFFEAPWPATALQTIGGGRVGILGTSLSAIDAIVTIATYFGQFARNGKGELTYRADPENEDFCAVMMSRKGLLPEADFYFPIPYNEPDICTQQAVDARIALGSSGLLDDVFELFRSEIAQADPHYARAIGLDSLTVDSFADAYYGLRDEIDPFEWAESNLAEAKLNYSRRHTVPWRYAILITHEIIESAVAYLNADDLARFNRSYKSIFADDYATVPHLSIERLLALRRCGRLEITALGEDAVISTEGLDRGAVVRGGERAETFDTFINATGQKTLSAEDFPFPTLTQKGFVSEARTVTAVGSRRRTGGIDVDEQCRPLIAGVQPLRRLYLPAVSYLLHKRPFIQGITSAAELGRVVATSILAEISRPQRSRRARSKPRLAESVKSAAA